MSHSKNSQLNNLLHFLEKTWGITLSADRIAGWEEELASGGGRDYSKLRQDIFTHVVGDDKVREWIIAEFDLQGESYTDERIDRIMGELTSGTRNFSDFRDDLYTARGYVDQGGGIYTKKTEDDEDDEDFIGTGSVTILTSKDMKWYRDPDTGQWMVSYKLPGSDRIVVFAATGSDLDAIFGDGQRPTSYETVSFAELTQRDGVTYAGNILEMTGTGTFEAEVARVIALGLDEGVLPDWAAGDEEVMAILFIAQSEDKSEEWVIEQLSELPSFQARFPGIAAFENMGLSTIEAVTAFLELEQGVKELILRDGGDPDSITPEMIGDLVAQGHSLTDVQTTYNIFDRLEKNAGALEAFNEVLVAHGKEPLDADGMFEFMAGTAPAELYEIWEESSLHQAAIEAGLNLTVEEAIALAMRTEGLTSFEAATAGLQNAAANILRFRGEIGLERFGLNEQDMIDLSLGLAPSSGASQADIGMNMERAFSSAAASRNRSRVNPFKRFSASGTPQASSLSGLRQESS